MNNEICIKCKFRHSMYHMYICSVCYHPWFGSDIQKIYIKFYLDRNQEMADKVFNMWCAGEFDKIGD